MEKVNEVKTYVEEFSESYKQVYDYLDQYLHDELISHIYDLKDHLHVLNNNVVEKEWIKGIIKEYPIKYREHLSSCVNGMTEEILNKFINNMEDEKGTK